MPVVQPSARPLGIAAISVVQPTWQVDNAWFGASMPRKFARHTGIERRAVSLEAEDAMAVAAFRQLERDTGCRPGDCRALLLVSPSLLPAGVARRHLDPVAVERERPGNVARRTAEMLGLVGCRTAGINWFCCGYARALELVTRRWAPRLDLGNGGYAVIVVATRISRITDYGDPQTGGLFGDMATATLLAPLDGRRHGVHFELVHADASRQPAARPAFDFQARADVPVPAPDGGIRIDERRVVYTLDGMAIAELAPREMAAAVASALAERGLDGPDVDHVVPHQAGTGIVNFAAMKLDDHGVRCEVVNGLTRGTGNTSACSIPHALRERWDSLHGLVACPAAAVGSPGRAEVLRGCVLLRSTPLHDRRGAAAA
ncbi:MAG: 3-oxoacyl-[acyl-carrier-protein] synthase III C-terminal domain-containing protein [Planctomycetaceae bacterium]